MTDLARMNLWNGARRSSLARSGEAAEVEAYLARGMRVVDFADALHHAGDRACASVAS